MDEKTIGVCELGLWNWKDFRAFVAARPSIRISHEVTTWWKPFKRVFTLRGDPQYIKECIDFVNKLAVAVAMVAVLSGPAMAGNSDYGGYGSYGRSSQSAGSGPTGGSTAPTDQYGRTSGGLLGAIGDFFRGLADAWGRGEQQNAPPSDCVSCGVRGSVDPALLTKQYGVPVA